MTCLLYTSYDQPRNPELFRFEPIPLSFEPVELGRCAPVLYSSAVRDMIDYSLRSCVERGVTVRRCKNCGRWFPQDVYKRQAPGWSAVEKSIG